MSNSDWIEFLLSLEHKVPAANGIWNPQVKMLSDISYDLLLEPLSIELDLEFPKIFQKNLQKDFETNGEAYSGIIIEFLQHLLKGETCISRKKQFEEIISSLKDGEENSESAYLHISKQLETLSADIREIRDSWDQKIISRTTSSTYSQQSDLIPKIKSNLPYIKNQYFTGRTTELEELHANFFQQLTTCRIQAIIGMGGIGKTQTALEYAYINQLKYNYIYWVKSETKEEIYNSYKEIATCIGLPQKDSIKSTGIY